MKTALLFAVKEFSAKLGVAMISEKFIEWAFFEIAERIVKSTATEHDDVWLKKIKEEYGK